MSEEKSSSIGTMIVVAIAAGLIGYVIGKPASPQVQVKTPDTSEKSTEQEKSTEPGKSTEPKEPAKSEAPLPKDIPSLKALAEKGDAKAQTSLGQMYRFGNGVEQDDKAAVKWFHKSAEQGHPTGQVCLAQMYRDGKGVKQDYKKAIEWLTKAAEQGYPIGHRGLGYLHLVGWGVPKDNEKAYAWFTISVASGLADAKKSMTGAAKTMTSTQITKAEALAIEMVKKNPKLLGKQSTASQKTFQKEDVNGVYQITNSQGKFRYIFSVNGTVVRFLNGEALMPAAWKIEGNEVHVEYYDGTHCFLRINPNSTLTKVAQIKPDGKRKEIVKNGYTAIKVQ